MSRTYRRLNVKPELRKRTTYAGDIDYISRFRSDKRSTSIYRPWWMTSDQEFEKYLERETARFYSDNVQVGWNRYVVYRSNRRFKVKVANLVRIAGNDLDYELQLPHFKRHAFGHCFD